MCREPYVAPRRSQARVVASLIATATSTAVAAIDAASSDVPDVTSASTASATTDQEERRSAEHQGEVEEELERGDRAALARRPHGRCEERSHALGERDVHRG